MSTQPLAPKKSHHADVMDDTSTSLPGFIAEEIVEGSNFMYGSTDQSNDLADQSSDSTNDPNNGYLLPQNQVNLVLIPIYLLIFLASLDATILSTLMTDIASDLNAIPYISWIATAYLLSTSIVQPLGKLSDIFGRKPSLLFCIAIFTVGCLQCAMATSTASFAMGRFLSGFAAGLNTLSTIIMSDLIPLRDRGVYQGLGNIFFAIGSAVGGTCGGWISQTWGWRMAFWIQVPIGLICFIVIWVFFTMPILAHEIQDKGVAMREKIKRIDIYGISLLASCLLCFITLTSVKFDNILFIVALLHFFFVGLYLLYKVESTHEYAIVPVALLGDRSVLGSSLANWFGTMYIFALMYYFPIYLITVVGIDSGTVGIRLIPNIVASSLSSIGSGYYMKWTGKYLKFSIIINSLGTFGIVVLLLRSYPGMLPSLFEQYTLTCLPYIAYASMITVTLLSLIAAVPPDHQSSVTSIQYAFRGMGSTLGTSISSFIFTSSLSSNLVKNLTKFKPRDVTDKVLAKVIDSALHDAKYIRSEDAPVWAIQPMIDSYGISCWWAFLYALIASFVCLLSIAVVKENKLHTTVKRAN